MDRRKLIKLIASETKLKDGAAAATAKVGEAQHALQLLKISILKKLRKMPLKIRKLLVIRKQIL